MIKLLVVETSPCGDASISRNMTSRFVSHWRAAHPEGKVTIRDRDIATQYLRLILGVIGITDVTVVSGGGAKLVDMGRATMPDFIGGLDAEIVRAANA